jgi:hypothetical protein
VRNVMPGREGLDRDVLLRLVDAAGGRSAESHPATGNLTFDGAPSQLDAVVRRLEDGIAGVIGRREPVAVRPHELLMAGRRDVRRPGATYLLPRPWRDEAATRSWSTVQRLAAVSSGGRQRHRTTSIGAMPSSAGRSKPHTCA